MKKVSPIIQCSMGCSLTRPTCLVQSTSFVTSRCKQASPISPNQWRCIRGIMISLFLVHVNDCELHELLLDFSLGYRYLSLSYYLLIDRSISGSINLLISLSLNYFITISTNFLSIYISIYLLPQTIIDLVVLQSIISGKRVYNIDTRSQTRLMTLTQFIGNKSQEPLL